jgi:hypothetical protein
MPVVVRMRVLYKNPLGLPKSSFRNDSIVSLRGDRHIEGDGEYNA